MKLNFEKANEYLTQSDEETDYPVKKQVLAIYNQAKIDDTKMIDHVDGVQTVELFEYAFTCRDFLNLIGFELPNLKLSRDSESLNIYIDRGDGEEPTNVCYWHEDEWLEDAATVVPAMLVAMELFYTNPEKLLNTLNVT